MKRGVLRKGVPEFGRFASEGAQTDPRSLVRTQVFPIHVVRTHKITHPGSMISGVFFVCWENPPLAMRVGLGRTPESPDPRFASCADSGLPKILHQIILYYITLYVILLYYVMI